MSNFPSLPTYRFYWRSIQLEPIPLSGERITLGTIVKGEDNALIVTRLVSKEKVVRLLGKRIGARIYKTLDLVLNSAEKYYSQKDILENWSSPVEGFYISKYKKSVAESIEEGLLVATRNSSFLSLLTYEDSSRNETLSPSFNSKTWKKEVLNQVKHLKSGFENCFEKDVTLVGAGVPFRFGFISDKYAAHFEAISTKRSYRNEMLFRAQSKLWQLDQLRDSPQLFPQELFELVLYQPDLEDREFILDFTEELKCEALRREIELYATSSPIDAASHVIERAA